MNEDEVLSKIALQLQDSDMYYLIDDQEMQMKSKRVARDVVKSNIIGTQDYNGVRKILDNHMPWLQEDDRDDLAQHISYASGDFSPKETDVSAPLSPLEETKEEDEDYTAQGSFTAKDEENFEQNPEQMMDDEAEELPSSIAEVRSNMRKCVTMDQAMAYYDYLNRVKVCEKDPANFQQFALDRIFTETRTRIVDGKTRANPRAYSTTVKSRPSVSADAKSKNKTKFAVNTLQNYKPKDVDKSSLKENNFVKMPIRQCRNNWVKPSVKSYTPARGYTWMMTRVRGLAKTASRKNLAVLGNQAALWFVQNTVANPHPKVLENMLVDQRIWVGNMNDTTIKKPVDYSFNDHMKVALDKYYKENPDKVLPKTQGKTLLYGIYPLNDLSELEAHAKDFKRDRPIYKAAANYLTTGQGDPALIRQGLTMVFQKNFKKQGFDGDTKSYWADLLEWAKSQNMLKYTKIVAFLIAVSQQSSLTGVLATMGMYVLQDTPEWLQALYTCILDIPVEQAASESLPFEQWSFASVGTAIGTALWNLAVNLCVWIMSDGLLTSTWSTITGFRPVDFADAVRTQCARMSIKSLAEGILVACISWSKKILRCFETRSLIPLLESAKDPTQWKMEAQAIRKYRAELLAEAIPTKHRSDRLKQLIDNGEIPDCFHSPLTPGEMETYVNRLVIVGRDLEQTYATTLVGRDISRELEHLYTIQIQNSSGYGVMQERVKPFCIFLSGPTGIGKTTMADDLFKAVGRSAGLSIDPSYKYSWQMGTNFQDGLSMKQWYIALNDIDIGTGPAALGQMDHAQVLMKLVDKDPFPVEQARVDLKGTECSRPLFVLGTTNFKEPNIKAFSLYPPAYFSRIKFWVEVDLKEEYRRNGGAMDVEKVGKCADNEYMVIRVRTYTGIAVNDSAFPFSEPVLYSRSEFFKLIVGEYAKHMEHQRSVISKRDSDKFCNACYQTLDDEGRGCGCQKQGLEKLLLPLAAIGLYTGYRFKNLAYWYVNDLWFNSKALFGKVNKTIDEASEVFLSIGAFQQRLDKALRFIPVLTAVPVAYAIYHALNYIYNSYSIRQGRIGNAVPDWVPSGWVRPNQDFIPGKPILNSTSTKDEVVAQVRDNMVLVHKESGSFIFYGLCISSNIVLMPKHIVSEQSKIIVVHKTVRHYVEMSQFSFTSCAADAILVRIPGLVATGLYKHFWPARDLSVKMLDELILVRDDVVEEARDKMIVTADHYDVMIRADFSTVVGDCGLAYVAKFNTGWRVGGIHIIANELSKTTFAQLVTQIDMDPAIELLSGSKQGIDICSKQISLQDDMMFEPYPAKSEIWSAKAFHDVEAYHIGTSARKVHGSSVKTKVRPTLIAEHFRNKELEVCGSTPYWVSPNFNGEMRDGKWVSPYSLSLVPLRRGYRKEAFYWLSLADYLSKLYDCDLEGYSTLTLEQAIVGVPHSPIQSADLSTSMGMPHNRKKRNYIAMKDGFAYVDKDNFLSVYEQMRKSLDDGNIVCPVIIGMLKDEQVSIEKRNKLETRVFGCLPFPFNAIATMDLAPVAAFLRNNALLFESMVGINMTSSECAQVKYCLDRVAPDDKIKKNNLDLDIRKQDKSEDGHSCYFVSKAYQAIMAATGNNWKRALQLCEGARCGVYVFKNDFFQMGAQNPSGYKYTVENNGVDNSQAHRYFYYRMKYGHTLPDELVKLLLDYMHNFDKTGGRVSDALSKYLTFRRDCGLVVYGDDSDLRVNRNRASFYDPSKIAELGLERGMIYTDGGKLAVISWKSFDELVFLKRSFRYIEGKLVARLSLKSIVKMLVLAKGSTLTLPDHTATLASDALRELVYHDRETFDEWASLIHEAMQTEGLSENPYYLRKDFDSFKQELLSGSFSAYKPYVEEVQNLCNEE